MKIVVALAFVIAVNLLFFFGQTAITSINPDATQFYTYDGSILSSYDASNYTMISNVTSILPEVRGGVTLNDNTNIFTDSFNAIKNWFLDSTGLNYLLALLNAIPSFLLAIGLPIPFAYGIGVLWHSITAFLIIQFIRGG